jgi:hypothetical protein
MKKSSGIWTATTSPRARILSPADRVTEIIILRPLLSTTRPRSSSVLSTGVYPAPQFQRFINWCRGQKIDMQRNRYETFKGVTAQGFALFKMFGRRSRPRGMAVN